MFQSKLDQILIWRNSVRRSFCGEPRSPSHTLEFVLANVDKRCRGDRVGCEVVDHDEARAIEVSTGRGSVAVLGECSNTFCVLSKDLWLSHLCRSGLGTVAPIGKY